MEILAEGAFLASRLHIPGTLHLCPKSKCPLASSARIHSGFSSPEMWSNLRTSQEHLQAQRSNEYWWPDRDLAPTRHRRASGLGPGCSKNLVTPSTSVERKVGCLRKGSAQSKPQDQYLPSGKQARVMTPKVSAWILQGRNCTYLSPSSRH